jgi:hypothetical protein
MLAVRRGDQRVVLINEGGSEGGVVGMIVEDRRSSSIREGRR